MRKLFAVVFILIMIVSLVACTGNDLEGTRWESSIGVGYNYSATFNGGRLTLGTPEGVQSYSYTLGDGNTITIDGSITYTYTITDNRLTFDKNLLGTMSSWYAD